MSIESVLPSNHLILCHPFLLLPSIFPSIRVFSNESALHIRWPKYWSFSVNISPSNEHSGLISFRMDWLDLLAVQGALESLLQHHSSKASILWHSAFFMVQFLHLYMTTGKTKALTRWTFVGKVMSLLFNMLSRRYGPISVFFRASVAGGQKASLASLSPYLRLFRHLEGSLAWGPSLLFGKSGKQRGPPGWGLTLQITHQALKGALWVGSCFAVQCLRRLMGQPFYCSAARCWPVGRGRGYGDGATPYM